MRRCGYAALVALVGCYDGVSGADGAGASDEGTGVAEGGSDAGDTGDDGPATDDCDAPRPGPSPIRRLTRRELDNTLRDLFGPDAALAANVLPPDVQPRIFDTDIATHGITEELAYAYLALSETVAQTVTADLDALVGCDPTTGEACARTFATSLCPRAWRRPCSADEVDDLVAAWATSDDFRDGIERMIGVVLQSADFLYRPEVGNVGAAEGDVVPLDGWEVASRLSYFLWGTMPDDALFAAAKDDALRDADAIEAQARRMLEDPRARDQMVWFHEQWLGLTDIERVAKDPALFPGFDAVRSTMREETAQFVISVVFDGGTLGDLLTSPTTFVDDALAAFYGLPAPGSPDALVRVELDPARHAGILTKGSFLAMGGNQASSSPVRRGVTVLRQIACGEPPPPPPDVDGSIPAPTPDTTTRDRFEAHVSDPACSGCHILFDPIGFAFEHFDAAGRWRDLDNGLPIDASGELVGTDVDGAFDGAADIAAMLADSERVHACYADRMFAFAAGRRVDDDADACTVDRLRADFISTDGELAELLVAWTRSDAFRYRRADL